MLGKGKEAETLDQLGIEESENSTTITPNPQKREIIEEETTQKKTCVSLFSKMKEKGGDKKGIYSNNIVQKEISGFKRRL
ncbi:hypothetical protein RND71_033758 [Anisodus tanguticus]|uniref:Uncharacterized protein n=1 Tax=Anisodus tanguticus TaxID=243964 RepID=A0AAE1R9Y3_9SOLA|nr:hypothetical protein RND71_033758 [Anisodus tanguticus]